MAKRRMFSKDVISTEWFTDMPAASQMLYVHLSMDADDDGFVTNTKIAMVNAHASKDDLKILVAKNYVIQLEDGLYLLKHWRQNNYLRNDRYRKSDYSDRLSAYSLKPDGSYTEKDGSEESVYQMDTNGIPPNEIGKEQGKDKGIPSNKGYTQDRLGQDRLGKDMSKPVLTSLKQPVLVAILRGYGFISEEEADDPQWDDLMDTFVKEHGLVDTKVKLKFVLDGHSHTVRKGEDAQGKPTFGKVFDHDDYAIGNKYCWLSTALDENFSRFSKEEGEDNELF